MGEAAFDELHGSLKRDAGGCEEKVDVIGHDDEGVEFIVAFAAIVLECVEEEMGVGGELEEAAPIIGLGADEEGSVACCSGGDRHRLPSLPQRLKPRGGLDFYGTAEAVPLRWSWPIEVDC
jgi:hypothetical protein